MGLKIPNTAYVPPYSGNRQTSQNAASSTASHKEESNQEESNSASAESLTTVSNYDASSLLYKLQQRGVNPLRPEVLAIIEFLPLAINNEDAQTNYQNLNFGSDAIVSAASNAALFAEVQRILKETSYSGIISLIEKESGMKLALMKLIIEYFIAVLNRGASSSTSTSDKLRKIFKEENNLDKCASELILAIINNDINLLPASIANLESTNIQTSEYRNPENLSIDDKLDFGQDVPLLAQNETLSLKSFITSNSTNNRIVLLARCAILQAVSAGVIKNIKNNTKIVDDFIKAVYLGEVVNPNLEISNFKYGSFLNEHSYDLTNEPLEKIGITLLSTSWEGDSDVEEVQEITNDNHSLSYSNNFILLNVIGGLICEMFFFNDKDESTPDNLIKINNEVNSGKIMVGRNSEFAEAITNLMYVDHGGLLSMGNRRGFSGGSSGAPEEMYDNASELFSFCIYNEVIGDLVYIKEKNIIKNYIDDISYNKSTDDKEKVLANFISKVLMQIQANSNDYPGFVNRFEDVNNILDFENITSQQSNSSFGSFTNFLLSYRSEKDISGTQLTGNKYLPLETSRGIYDFDLGDYANLIPVEDAFINNIVNNSDFNSSNISNEFDQLTSFSNAYIENIKNLSEDIIRLFGIGYEKDAGTITEIAQDSQGDNVTIKGITPANYLNYYLEGIAKDLDNFLQDLSNYTDVSLGEASNTGDSAIARGKILSLAMLLSAESGQDYLNLFRGFYFQDRTYRDHMALPTRNYPTSADEDFKNLEKQYKEQGTAGTDYSFINLFENKLGISVQKQTKNFSNGNGSWESCIYHEGILQDIQSSGDFPYKEITLGNPSEFEGTDGWQVYDFAKSSFNNGHRKIVQAALVKPYRNETYSNSNPKACIQLGDSFYQRLVNSPILYTSLQDDSSKTSYGQCSSAINLINFTTLDYITNRFTNAGYYDSSGDEKTHFSGQKSFSMGGVAKLTHIQKCYAIFIWYVKLLQNTIGVNFGARSHEAFGFSVHTLKIVINKDKIQGVIAALKGTNRNDIILESDLTISSYDNANEYLSKVRGAVTRKKKQLLTKINVLAKNALDIQQEGLDIINSLSTTTGNSDSPSFSIYTKKYFSNYSNKFILSRDAGGNATKYYYDHLAYEKKSFPLAKYDKKDIKEYKRMYQVLSQKGFNLLQNEKLGRKNIINVGIPSGLVDTLAQQAFSKTGDDQFLDSTLIALYLHRKNELTEEEEVFPRPYVFDTAKYISNINSSNAKLIPDLEYLNELSEGNFSDINNLFEIAHGKTSYLLSDRNQPDNNLLGFIDNGFGFSSIAYNFVEGQAELGINYSRELKDDVCLNHILDYNLKLYQNLMLDLEFESYNFLLEKENLYVEGVDDSQIVSSRRNSFRNFLFAYFPSFNVDEKTRLRVSKAILNYDNLLFNNVDKKLRQITSGLIFDRVFSIPFSDRDFVLKTDLDYKDIYGVDIPIIRAGSRNYISNVTEINDNSKKIESNYVNKINNNESGTIYKFFVTANILKRW